jgi:HK97 family phage prohead protease
MDKEIRYFQEIELRDDNQTDDGTIGMLEGYAAVFNSDSVLMGRSTKFVERIAPGAFTRTISERPDVRALWNHESGAVIARAPKTLTLTEDEKGLKASIRLVDTTVNRDLIANVKAGNVDGMSFGFRVVAEEWRDDKENKREIRTLLDVDLLEVSAVTFPAYTDTSIAERSLEEYRSEQQKLSEEQTEQLGQDKENKPDALLDYYDLAVRQAEKI